MLSAAAAGELERGLPFFGSLRENEKNVFLSAAATKSYERGQHLYNGGNECAGFIFVRAGQLRAYITSEEGKEITLYRLLDGDVCIMSASCMLKT